MSSFYRGFVVLFLSGFTLSVVGQSLFGTSLTVIGDITSRYGNISGKNLYLGKSYQSTPTGSTPFMPNAAYLTPLTIYGVNGKVSYYAQRGTDLVIKAGDRIGSAASHVASTYPYGIRGGDLIFKCSSGLSGSNGVIYFKSSSNKSIISVHEKKIWIGDNGQNTDLSVRGQVSAKKFRTSSTGADFVFEPDYKLLKLEEVAEYVKDHKHLPDIAPAKTMQKEGIDLGEMNTKLLQKVEELTLYLIDQNQKIIEQNQKIKILEQKVITLEQR